MEAESSFALALAFVALTQVSYLTSHCGPPASDSESFEFAHSFIPVSTSTHEADRRIIRGPTERFDLPMTIHPASRSSVAMGAS